jgi:predicted dehydrogenase
MKYKSISRRKFISRSVATTASFFIVPRFVLGGKNFVPPSDRIVLGFIGTGKQATGLQKRFHAQKDAMVLAGCDVDKLKLERFKKASEDYYSANTTTENYNGCLTFTDYRELLALKEIDAVVISTPDHWHAPQTVDAAKKGKDIYCEKPLAHTVNEGIAMVKAVKKYKRVLQTGSMQRSNLQFHKACELVRNGYIGEIKQVLVSVGGPPIPCVLPTEPTPDYLNWNLWLGPAPERGYNNDLSPHISIDIFPNWRNYREYGGGGVTDWGAHMFDIAHWGLGMDRSGPIEIIPPDGKDLKYLMLRYKSGVEMFHQDFGRGAAVRFIGTKGSIDISRSFFETTPANLKETELSSSDVRLYNSRDHHGDWLQAIRNRTQPICDVETGHRTSSVCNLINIAYQLDRPLKWSPKKENFGKDKDASTLLGKTMRAPWELKV